MRWTALGLGTALLLVGASCSTSENKLTVGDCIRQIPAFSNQSVARVSCSETGLVFRVVSNDDATGESYPGNISALESQCRAHGGTPIGPSQQSWEQDGDRNVLCVTLNH